MENPFYQGQIVVCCSNNFPLIKEYGGTGKEAERCPAIGEQLQIDEILGEFLRFDKYDSEESYNWWKHDRFKPLTETEMQKEIEILIDHNTNRLRP